MPTPAADTLSRVTASVLPREQLYARTTEISNPGALLALAPRTDTYAWIRQDEGMIGWGEVVRYKPTSVLDAAEWWAELAANVVGEPDPDLPAGAGLMAFGSFAFDPTNTAAQSTLIVPQVVIGRRQGRAWRTVIGTHPEADVVLPTAEPQVPPRGVAFADGALSGPEWESAVAVALDRISQGTIDKVVLARDLLAFAADDLDPRWLATQLAARYARCWTYAVDGLVGATPEMLVRREAGLVTSRVLAGTIRRTGNEIGDLALAAALGKSSKDLEEHEHAVRSVARALLPYCSGMHVPDAPYVLDLPNVLHLATDVTAVADRGASSLALAAALHPSAAVCGTPTDAARATIAELEHLDRERYAGPVGWIDASGDGEWGIALRCGQISETDPRQIRLYAGCGIVAGSDPRAELAESNAKLVPMRDALTADSE